MSDKSIDGLKRRTNSGVMGTKNTKAGQKKTKSSDLGLKRRQISVAGEKTSRSVPTKKMAEHDEAIKDFLTSVQDEDPTNLVGEIPEKEDADKKSKRWHKRNNKKKAKKEKHGKKKSKKKVVLIVVGSILAIIIAAVAWLYIQGNAFISKITGGGDLWSVITADPDIPLQSDPNSGRTNVLIFGTEGYSMDDSSHPGSQLTDTIMVASLDQDTGDVRTVSLPRDFKAKTCTSTSKINEVYYCTYYKNKGTTESKAEYEKLAARALADQVEEILGIKIQYFAHANWQAVVQIVDALGGIDVAFVYQGTTWTGNEIAIETTDKRGLADYWIRSSQSYEIQFDNNKVYHLNGAQALGVARARNESSGYGASGGNFSREQFQQKILQSIILKAKETNFATDFMAALSILEAVGDNLRTDFKDTEMKTLFKLASVVDMGGLQSVSLQKTDDGSSLLTSGMLQSTNGQYYSYVYPAAGATNYTAIKAYINKKFSSDPVVSEGAAIEVMNATAAAGLAASEKTTLVGKGYTVTKTANAPSDFTDMDGVKIYQLNKTMGGTAKALKSLYGVSLITDIPDSLSKETVDFVIILGNGYATEGTE